MLRDFRIFEHIDYLEIVPAFKLLLANSFQVCDGGAGSRARAGYKESEQVLGQVASAALGALNANRHVSTDATPKKVPSRPAGCIT